MYQITFVTKKMTTKDAFVDTQLEYGAIKTVVARSDYDLLIATKKLSDEEADLIRCGWLPFSTWKWYREVGRFNVSIRTCTMTDNDGCSGWEVIVERDEMVFDTPNEYELFKDAIVQAKREFAACEEANKSPEFAKETWIDPDGPTLYLTA